MYMCAMIRGKRDETLCRGKSISFAQWSTDYSGHGAFL